MLSLYVISIVVSVCVGTMSFLAFSKVRDRNLGYEEIITLSVALCASINTSIDLMNVMDMPFPLSSMIIKEVAVMSRLMMGLLSYFIIKYIDHMHAVRLTDKEE